MPSNYAGEKEGIYFFTTRTQMHRSPNLIGCKGLSALFTNISQGAIKTVDQNVCLGPASFKKARKVDGQKNTPLPPPSPCLGVPSELSRKRHHLPPYLERRSPALPLSAIYTADGSRKRDLDLCHWILTNGLTPRCDTPHAPPTVIVTE